MRDTYERKYSMKFWVLPPLVPENLLHREPRPFLDQVDRKRGVLLGNIWGQRWLDMLRDVFVDTGYQIDWYCNQKDPIFLDYDRKELTRHGITLKDPIADSLRKSFRSTPLRSCRPTRSMVKALAPSRQ